MYSWVGRDRLIRGVAFLSDGSGFTVPCLQDFSFVMREFRLFYVKLPNGYLAREIFSVNKPISELLDRLCDYLGIGENRC